MKHELTLTLRPLLYTRTPKEQYELVTPLLKQALQGYKYTMIAELTSNELNVHYHAIIDINGLQEKNVLLNRLRPLSKYLGRKTCQAVQFETSYNNYLKKDLKKTQKVIIDPVVKDDYKLFQKDLFGEEHRKKQGQIADLNRQEPDEMGLNGVAPFPREGVESEVEAIGTRTPSYSPLDDGIDFTEQRI